MLFYICVLIKENSLGYYAGQQFCFFFSGVVVSFGQKSQQRAHERVMTQMMDADLTSGAAGIGGWKVVVVRTASWVVGAVWNEKSG